MCFLPNDVYLFVLKYVFIWLHRFLVLGCGISSLWHIGSLVAACGIQVPEQWSDPGPMHWEYRVLAAGPPWKPPAFASTSNISVFNSIMGLDRRALMYYFLIWSWIILQGGQSIFCVLQMRNWGPEEPAQEHSIGRHQDSNPGSWLQPPALVQLLLGRTHPLCRKSHEARGSCLAVDSVELCGRFS